MVKESKIVIGLAGEKGSGKQTFTNILKEIAPESITHIVFSDILFKTLMAWDLPTTRANLQTLAVAMINQYGPDTLTHAVESRAQTAPTKVVVLDGVRWWSDVQMIRRFPRHRLVYVTADLNLRYERLKNKSDKRGEAGLSFQQFMEEEQKQTEIEIPRIGHTAELKVVNNGTVEQLKSSVWRFYQDFLVPQLS